MFDFKADDKMEALANTGAVVPNRKDAKLAHFASFWQKPENAEIVEVGHFLALSVRGTRLADALVAGGINLPEKLVVRDDKGIAYSLPISEGYRTLKIAKGAAWLCPSCGSAHGAGIGASANGNDGEADAGRLASHAKFYYNPSKGLLFTISQTCFARWCKGKVSVLSLAQWDAKVKQASVQKTPILATPAPKATKA